MQKIFNNKETDMVEQILEVLTEGELSDDYFENCYSLIDYDDKINTYNLRYNKEKETFEVVEGMKEKEEIEVVPSEIERLKEENKELKNKFNSLEETLKKILERGV